ncbi:hypothetical protein FKM82_011216 [Ascaphus truei]
MFESYFSYIQITAEMYIGGPKANHAIKNQYWLLYCKLCASNLSRNMVSLCASRSISPHYVSKKKTFLTLSYKGEVPVTF